MNGVVEEVDSPWYGRIRILRRDAEMGAAVRAGALWERRLVRVYTAHVDPGSTVVDVGANIGCHSIVLASLVGPRGRVVAYEPQPLPAALLAANTAALAADVRVRRVAVGRTPGTMSVFFPDYEASANPGGWSLEVGAGNETKQRVELSDAPEEVAVVRLDDEGDALGRRGVALIKIDVEGMELGVLEGAAGLLTSDGPAIFVETREHREAVDDFLASVGYCRLEAVGTPAGADYATVPASRRGRLLASLEPNTP